MSAFLAGFAKGASEELDRAIERKQRREEFMAEMLEKRKTAVLPVLMERLSERRQKISNTMAMIDSFEDLGFSRETALVLHASGQLDSELERLQKLGPGKVSTTYKKTLEDIAKKYAAENPDKYAKIISLGLQEEPTNSNEELEAIMKIMNATNEEELIQSGVEVSRLARPQDIPSIAKFTYNPEKSVAILGPERKSVFNQIVSGVSPTLSPQYFTETDGYRMPQEKETGDLIRALVEQAINIAETSYGPFQDMNSTAAADYVINRVYKDLAEGIPLSTFYEQSNIPGNTHLQQLIIDRDYVIPWDKTKPRVQNNNLNPSGMP